MSEIMARVNAEHLVELIDDQSASIASVPPMTPQDAAFLARGMLACAAALTAENPPPVGAIVGDAHIPVFVWTTMTSTASGRPVLILSIPPGIELTFELTLEGAKEMGEALVFAAASLQPLVVRSGTVH